MTWSPDLKTEGDALLSQIAKHPEKTFHAALDAEVLLRAQAFQRGVKAYHRHPYQRTLKDPVAIWQEGNSRLLDYGGKEDGPVVLAIPSLINKAYILDLNAKRSLMRYLAKRGLRCFLLDWGELGETEKHFNLEDYVLGRLKNALDAVTQQTGRPVNLVGYCMGGVLATALCVLEPEKIERLVLLATPWDFHAGGAHHTRLIQNAKSQLDTTLDLLGHLPVDVIQALFAALDPYSIIQKFANFAKLDADSEDAKKFVALEDWLNDGVALAGPVARECLFGWYIDNQPATGKWHMDGCRIDPGDITCPSLIIIPEKDRIVPPESAYPLGKQIANATVHNVPAGHIGMMCGKSALKRLYQPLAKWLLKQEK